MNSYKIGKILAKVRRPGKIPAEYYQDEGDYPIIDQGEGRIAGYTDDKSKVLFKPLPIIVFGDHTRAIKLARKPFACGADGTQLVYPNTQDLNLIYLYYAIKNLRLSNYFYARHFKFLKDQIIKSGNPSEQKKVVDILEPNDLLIENNEERINLLDQEIRLIYRQWFVYLRFPGYEKVKIIDGVPEGWNKKPLGEIAQLKYGEGLSEMNRKEGVVPVFGSSGIVGTHEIALVKGPGIIIGRKGNIGSVFWSDTNYFPIDTVYYIEKEQSSFYLYYTLLTTPFINTDAAVPGLNRNLAHSRKVLIPDPVIRAKFELTASLIHEQKKTLLECNKNLELERDLSLPRLMNGEIAL